MKKTSSPFAVRHLPPAAGFALLEVLISILLFSLGILGMIAMQARAVQFSTDAEDRTRAALLANELATVILEQQTVVPTSASVTAWKARVTNPAVSGLPGTSAAGSLSTADATGAVTISITWRGPSKKSTDADSNYSTKVIIP